MVSMGIDAFRFSIAWTRILPDRSGTPNIEGIGHYNNLIDKLIDCGRDNFVAYANVCFAAFGDRVKYWVTFDEPNDYVGLAYASTQSPPGRCTPGYGFYGNCTMGNSSTEPYLVAHNIHLAHSAVAKLYKTEYKPAQGGSIGMAPWFKWYEPLNVSDVYDVAAAKRAQDFLFGWFMDPLVTGEYPETMRSMLGSRLPSFTEEEADDLRDSMDLWGSIRLRPCMSLTGVWRKKPSMMATTVI
ncbi:hypothetical protein L7F22_050706 [Adiantum nelumboides]|nr:hypothetical protein [Adiantum nelumboides]